MEVNKLMNVPFDSLTKTGLCFRIATRIEIKYREE